jgi:hypothetical protein
MKMKLLAVLAALSLGVAGAQAASGIFGSFVQVNGTWYQGLNSGANQITSLQALNLGTFNINDLLQITGANVLTYKNGGSDVTGADINWRVWSGTPSGSFAGTAVGFGSDQPFNDPAGNGYSGAGDQNWGNLPGGGGVQTLSTATPGTYTLDLYYSAATSDGAAIENGGSVDNYRATFTVVPEPSTIALAALGLIGMVVARRRMAK